MEVYVRVFATISVVLVKTNVLIVRVRVTVGIKAVVFTYDKKFNKRWVRPRPTLFRLLLIS